MRILFFGDSITDASRNREGDFTLGNYGVGFVRSVVGTLMCEAPDKYEIINRGISGHRVVDLYARVKIDCWNLQPDVLNILIGVNDVWHEVAYKNGVATPKFERVYRMLLDEIYEELPDTKILLFTPFVLEGTSTVDPENPAKWAAFRDGTAERAEAVCRIAKDYPVTLSVTQPLFDEAAKAVPAHHLTWDGVHPTLAGNEILAAEFIKWFESVK